MDLILYCDHSHASEIDPKFTTSTGFLHSSSVFMKKRSWKKVKLHKKAYINHYKVRKQMRKKTSKGDIFAKRYLISQDSISFD